MAHIPQRPQARARVRAVSIAEQAAQRRRLMTLMTVGTAALLLLMMVA